MLVGNRPYLVDRIDGGLHQIGVVPARGGDRRGGDAPAHLVAVTVEQVVEPINPVFAVETIRQGKPPR